MGRGLQGAVGSVPAFVLTLICAELLGFSIQFRAKTPGGTVSHKALEVFIIYYYLFCQIT